MHKKYSKSAMTDDEMQKKLKTTVGTQRVAIYRNESKDAIQHGRRCMFIFKIILVIK